MIYGIFNSKASPNSRYLVQHWLSEIRKLIDSIDWVKGCIEIQTITQVDQSYEFQLRKYQALKRQYCNLIAQEERIQQQILINEQAYQQQKFYEDMLTLFDNMVLEHTQPTNTTGESSNNHANHSRLIERHREVQHLMSSIKHQLIVTEETLTIAYENKKRMIEDLSRSQAQKVLPLIIRAQSICAQQYDKIESLFLCDEMKGETFLCFIKHFHDLLQKIEFERQDKHLLALMKERHETKLDSFDSAQLTRFEKIKSITSALIHMPPTATNQWQENGLHLAAKSLDLGLVEIYIKLGLTPHTPNIFGITALQMAQRSQDEGKDQVINFLRLAMQKKALNLSSRSLAATSNPR